MMCGVKNIIKFVRRALVEDPRKRPPMSGRSPKIDFCLGLGLGASHQTTEHNRLVVLNERGGLNLRFDVMKPDC